MKSVRGSPNIYRVLQRSPPHHHHQWGLLLNEVCSQNTCSLPLSRCLNKQVQSLFWTFPASPAARFTGDIYKHLKPAVFLERWKASARTNASLSVPLSFSLLHSCQIGPDRWVTFLALQGPGQSLLSSLRGKNSAPGSFLAVRPQENVSSSHSLQRPPSQSYLLQVYI